MYKTKMNKTVLELKTKRRKINQQKDKIDSMSLVIIKLCANTQATYCNLEQKHWSINNNIKHERLWTEVKRKTWKIMDKDET